MGATPAPMALSDLYPALAQGVVDGAENPLPVLYGAKLHEQAKYCSLTGHILILSQFVGGERYLASLPQDVQELLDDTGREAGLYMNDLIVRAEEETVGKLKAEGVTFNQVDKAAFRRASRSVYDSFPLWTPGLYEHVVGLIRRYRQQRGTQPQTSAPVTSQKPPRVNSADRRS
jgi:TRAP-type C4-dicarboxylate transport system substrate-binding protein